jgi:hypothetical protein
MKKSYFCFELRKEKGRAFSEEKVRAFSEEKVRAFLKTSQEKKRFN